MLWAGLPVITLPGPTKPARVAATIATAAGCSLGVARTLSDYVSLAVAVANRVRVLAPTAETVHTPHLAISVSAQSSMMPSSALPVTPFSRRKSVKL
jgi:hypothetical protein